MVAEYKLPRLNYYTGIPSAVSYEEKKNVFFRLIDELEPGLTEIVFHPSVETENLKNITGSWQQRVWEAELFFDSEVNQLYREKCGFNLLARSDE